MKSQAVDANLDPPKIFCSSKPAVLVIFMGGSQFKPTPKPNAPSPSNAPLQAVAANAAEPTSPILQSIIQNQAMNAKNIITSALLLSAIPATAGTTIPSISESIPVASTENNWRVSTSLYGWFTRLDGDMVIRGTSIPVDVPFDKIFDNLKFTFMGLVEVGKGRWSFMSDVFYAKLEPSAETRRAIFDSQIEQFIGNFAVFYNVVQTSTTRFDTYAGARVNWMQTDVDITGKGPLGKTFSRSAEKTWIDPIIGLRYHRDLSEKFFVRALGDIGGFGISSDFTWQAMLSLGYRVTDHASLGLGYRGLGTDYTSGGTTYDVISHGLLLGLEYKF